MKNSTPDVCVLMSTYNGEKYLREQLDSILDQEGVKIKLLVRDDGSRDGTLQILEEYNNKGLLTYYTGENLGPAHSFLQLLKDAPESSYYAFSDQDDVWLKNKLISGVSQIKGFDDIPAFYDSMTTVVDANLIPTGKKFGSKKVYNFATQIARSNVIGCTMIMNKQLQIVIASKNPNYIVMHDQWIASVCKGIGGIEVKDPESYILYRQHINNEVGAKQTVSDRIKTSALKSRQHSRLRLAKEIKKIYSNDLNPNNRRAVYFLASSDEEFTQKIKCAFINFNCGNIFIEIWIKISILLGTF